MGKFIWELNNHYINYNICEDLLLTLQCMQLYSAYWVEVVFSYECRLGQLHLCSAHVLSGSYSCGVIQACLYQEEVYNNLMSDDAFILLWSASLASVM